MRNILSSVSIDGGVKEKFHMDGNRSPSKEPDEPEKELKYVNIQIKPVIFMDDLLNASKSIEIAQRHNIRMEELIEEKLLDFNLNKSCFLVAGEKQSRKNLQKNIEKKPLLLCNVPMKQVQEERYLGCQIGVTVGDSVASTVKRRLALASRTIYEARTVMEDSRAMVVGGISIASKI